MHTNPLGAKREQGWIKPLDREGKLSGKTTDVLRIAKDTTGGLANEPVTAEALRKAKYDVVMNPTGYPGGKTPDLELTGSNGKFYADIYSPKAFNKTAYDEIWTKAYKYDGTVVVNIDKRTDKTARDLIKYLDLDHFPIPALKNLIVVKGSAVDVYRF